MERLAYLILERTFPLNIVPLKRYENPKTTNQLLFPDSAQSCKSNDFCHSTHKASGL